MSEKEIIKRVIEGEVAFYEILVRRFNLVLYKVGRSYNFNHQDTEDLMQETFIGAFLNLEKFQFRASFKTWISRIMLNNCYHKRNKLHTSNEYIKSMEDHKESINKHTYNDVEEKMRSRELNRIVEQALLKIPLEYRLVFTMRYANSFSTHEVAELLSISENNVKVRLNRAKAKLRREIEKNYKMDELFEFNLIHFDPMVERVMQRINKIKG